MASSTYDLTRGGILKKLLQVAVPIMGTQLMQMAYNLTDMFWLGQMRYSVTAVAASGMAGMYLWLGMSLMMFGRMGSEIGTSQNLGRGDRDAALGFAQDSTRLSLVLGVAYGLFLLTLTEPLVALGRGKLIETQPDGSRIVSIHHEGVRVVWREVSRAKAEAV